MHLNLSLERSGTQRKVLLDKNGGQNIYKKRKLVRLPYICRRPLRIRNAFVMVLVFGLAVCVFLYNNLGWNTTIPNTEIKKQPLITLNNDLDWSNKPDPKLEVKKKKPLLVLPGDEGWTKPWPPFKPPPLSVGPIINRKVFNHAQRCLVNSSFVNGSLPTLPILNFSDYELPHDVEQHYFDLLNYTSPLRQINISSYAEYNGPWLENEFIARFCCDKPLSYFGGYVPLFVQWTDLSHTSADKDKFVAWFNKTYSRNFISMLRKDVIYLAVVQHAKGPFLDRMVVHPQDHWNILVLSGGGNGHVPIPLLLKELPFEPELATKPRENLFVFAGTYDVFSVRNKMTRALSELSTEHHLNFKYNIYKGPEWKQVMRTASLNLAPRGYGRTSFRLAECIQMGLIPVYLWDDHEWAPYKGSPAYVGNFGFSMNIKQFKDFVKETVRGLEKDPNYLKIPERTAMMKRFRESHYTMDGLMERIQYFLQGDPRSDFACQRHPYKR